MTSDSTKIVETTMELLRLMRTAKENDIVKCKETQGTYIFKDKGWTCIATDDEGYQYLYGQDNPQ